MNETLTTRQLRLVALLLGVVVIAAGYWMVVRKHSTTSPSTASSTPVSTTPTSSTPSKTHTHKAAPPAKTLATHGMPVAVARALQKHSVVVSLYSPQAGLDKLATAEARAGAAASGVGFVAVDVFHQRAGIPVLRKLGIVDTPAVLVVTRRRAVTAELKGFVDRNVVAQAVSDAR